MNALHDQNGKPTIIATSNVDTSIVRVTSNVSNNGLSIDDNTTGSDIGNNGGIASIDDNGVSVMTALSSTGDGTLVEVYCDADGKLLINSN